MAYRDKQWITIRLKLEVRELYFVETWMQRQDRRGELKQCLKYKKFSHSFIYTS